MSHRICDVVVVVVVVVIVRWVEMELKSIGTFTFFGLVKIKAFDIENFLLFLKMLTFLTLETQKGKVEVPMGF